MIAANTVHQKVRLQHEQCLSIKERSVLAGNDAAFMSKLLTLPFILRSVWTSFRNRGSKCNRCSRWTTLVLFYEILNLCKRIYGIMDTRLLCYDARSKKQQVLNCLILKEIYLIQPQLSTLMACFVSLSQGTCSLPSPRGRHSDFLYFTVAPTLPVRSPCSFATPLHSSVCARQCLAIMHMGAILLPISNYLSSLSHLKLKGAVCKIVVDF